MSGAAPDKSKIARLGKYEYYIGRWGMDNATDHPLVSKYRSERYLYERLARHVRRFLVGEVKADFKAIAKWPLLHDHKSRAKDIESLRNNLDTERYNPPPVGLADIKDLAGARLIFYFRRDLDQFWARLNLECLFGKGAHDSAKQIKKSAMHAAEETDKETRRAIPARYERFGYDSFHFTCEVEPGTKFYAALSTNDKKLLKGRKCEVQLRTILQHAWAETEHDLRYKLSPDIKSELPAEENRNWSVLAAAIEIADSMLEGRQDYFSRLPQSTLPESSPIRSYIEPEYGVRLDGVRYAYEILHEATRDNNEEMPSVKPDQGIFDVDAKLNRIIPNYKDAMWARLKKSKPDFIPSSFSHDSTVVRVSDWNENARTLTVQPAQYSDQIVTNHRIALDEVVKDTMRVEDLAYRQPGTLLDLSESPMSNTIGVAGVVFTQDSKWIIGFRSRKVAFDPDQWGCSASGAVEWTGPENWRKPGQENWVKNALARECDEELGYRPKPDEIHYLAFTRAFIRAGKPQFFFLIKPCIDSVTIKSKWQVYASDENELSEIKILNTEDAKILAGNNANKIDAIIGNTGLSEELRMNLALALRRIN
jgi:ppGpp synthetase/RelA/SpoT-type nucleotidyltranferase/8-oxo-dGTP pyrophosphatase MutT (NUDIX family)